MNEKIIALHSDINSELSSRREKVTSLFLGPEDKSFGLSIEFEIPEDTELLTEESVRMKSPFTDYFGSNIKDYNVELSTIDFQSISLNAFYFPAIFSNLNKYLAFVPIWSGIGLSNNGR